MSEERLGEGEREGSLKRDLGEEDLGGGAGELGNRSEWRPMEGSKESAGEEDGWQGGGGYRWTVVWIPLFECAFLGAEGVLRVCPHSK